MCEPSQVGANLRRLPPPPENPPKLVLHMEPGQKTIWMSVADHTGHAVSTVSSRLRAGSKDIIAGTVCLLFFGSSMSAFVFCLFGFSCFCEGH